MYLSVIIPMYNERSVAESCVRALSAELEESGERYEILFSDDGSTDGCGDIVKNTAHELDLSHGEVRVVRSEENRGKGHAVKLGVASSRGDVVVFTDCDLAYGTHAIRGMAEQMQADPADLLIGSRAIAKDGYAGYTFARKLASKAYLKFLALSAGFRCTDSQCGIKMFRGDAARLLFSQTETDGWSFDFEVLLRAEKQGFRIKEYPVAVLNHRDSKIHLFRDSLRMLRDIRRIKGRVK